MPVLEYALLNNVYREFPMRISLRGSLGLGLGIVALGVLSGGLWAQSTEISKPHGAPTYWHPESNKQKPSDVGFRAHTNVIGLTLPDVNKGADPFIQKQCWPEGVSHSRLLFRDAGIARLHLRRGGSVQRMQSRQCDWACHWREWIDDRHCRCLPQP